MIDGIYTYVLGIDLIPKFCFDCESKIPEGGKKALWLFRMSITDAGRFHVDALCPECGLKKAPILAAALAASWEKFQQIHEAHYAATATAQGSDDEIH